jgi:hypothetical protein
LREEEENEREGWVKEIEVELGWKRKVKMEVTGLALVNLIKEV